MRTLLRVAVDSGGTFTDVVGEYGGLWFVAKVASTPDDPARGVLEAVRIAAAHFGVPADTLVHGTTVATNALLERRGARVALVTNRGFADVLDIDRQHRPESALYSLQPAPRVEVVQRADRIAVDVRRGPAGEIWKALDPDELRDAVRALDDSPRSWAICLLHSWRNADDEYAAAAALSSLRPGEHVSCSADVVPEIREVERFHTTVANAHVLPVMERYLGRIRDAAGTVHIMGSAGGRLPVATASALPVATALSGPAGGVAATQAIARLWGEPGFLSFDMGGTSTDVCLCTQQVPVRRGASIGDFQIHLPMLDVHTVGAGGGSLIDLDATGALRVGPRSAGAVPGPACYGRGELPTVTDADVLLGRLPADARLGGFLTLQPARSDAAFAPIANALGVSTADVARGAIAVVDEAMAAAVRRISLERGVDPRTYTLCAFGGAGGLHACGVADHLGQRRIVVPGQAGVWSAAGMLLAPAAVETTRTVIGLGLSEMSAARDALRELATERLGATAHEHTCWASLRYAGQGHTLEVPFDDAAPDAIAAFRSAHRARFGHELDSDVVFESLRVRVSGEAPDATLKPPVEVSSCAGPTSLAFETHTVFVAAGWRATIYDDNTVWMHRIADALCVGAGPQDDATRLALFRYRFEAVAEEMGEVLMRAAFSPNIRERRDHSCAIFDAAGNMIAQAAHIPVHLGAAPAGVQYVIRNLAVPDGQHAITNDPYCGGTHLPDISLVTPVTLGDTRFWVASRAHHADIGGIAPGSLPLSKHIDEEGWRCPPTLLDDAVIASLYSASRTPDERRGDLEAQLAANRRGAELLRELAATHGEAELVGMSVRLHEAGARAMDRLLSFLPHGCYEATDGLHDVAPGIPEARIRLRLGVGHDGLHFDFTASDPQVPGPFNATRAIAESAVFYALRCLLPADVPTGSGVMARVRIATAPGTLVDAAETAAVAAGNVETSQRLVDVVFAALAQALPDRVPAASYGSMNNLLIGSLPGARPVFAYYETIGGGGGGGPAGGGASAMQAHMTNTRNTPVEVLESTWPLRVREYSIRRGSGGRGECAGGDGIVREIEVLSPAHITLLAERRREGAPGLGDGAQCGMPGRDTLTLPGEAPRVIDGGKVSVEVPGGTVVRVETPGGGGWSRRRVTSSG